MSSGLGIFFCDLNPGQESAATKWSSANGLLKDYSELVPEPLSLIPGGNIKIEVETELAKSAIDPTTEDLLACAFHIYQADRLIVRPESRWSRKIELHIGVNNLQEYEAQAGEIGRILGYVAKDQITIQFYKLAKTRPVWKMPGLSPVLDSVCVFSDSIDSMTGLAVENKTTNVLASFQYGPGKPRSYHMTLLDEIEKATNNRPDYVGFKINPMKIYGRDLTQRSRGFLQLSLAAAVARRTGLKVIRVFGNGFSSYHLQPRQICGPGFAVRDTHPFFLRDMLELFGKLKIIKNVQIFNQFQFSTPTEVLRILEKRLPGAAKKLFNYTNNCAEQELAKGLEDWNSGSIPHCGCCFPCKIRRLAALKAEFEMENDFDAYSINPMTSTSEKRMKLGPHLQRRFDLFHVQGLADFKTYLEILKNPVQIASILGIGPDLQELSTMKLDYTHEKKSDDAVHRGIIDLHKNFANEVLGYFP